MALWVTNRERHRRFIEAELLPAWGLRQVAQWHWLKVTDDGRPVSRLDVAHRRPYESLLLCWPAPAEPPPAGGEAPPCPGPPPVGFQPPPEQLVVAAVPAQHSRKPQLGLLLAPYLPTSPRRLEVRQVAHASARHLGWVLLVCVCVLPHDAGSWIVIGACAKLAVLQMFARELVAGQTSWGNEVLRFQSEQMFCAADAQ